MNRKQRKENQKKIDLQNHLVLSPFTKHCESFASDYLTSILEPDANIEALIEGYDKGWRDHARNTVVPKMPEYYKNHKFAKKHRNDLFEQFKNFADKFIDKQSRGEIIMDKS